jgi:hypothetical protein
MVERSRELFTMLKCVIHHQCNAERSGAERSGDGRKVQVMEERSREHFTMLRCVIHHQCNTERSGDGRKVQGTFYNVEVRYSSSV